MGLTRYEALQILGLEEGLFVTAVFPFVTGAMSLPTCKHAGCTEKEIRERFKKLALKWHPDKNFHNPDEAQKVMVYRVCSVVMCSHINFMYGKC